MTVLAVRPHRSPLRVRRAPQAQPQPIPVPAELPARARETRSLLMPGYAALAPLRAPRPHGYQLRVRRRVEAPQARRVAVPPRPVLPEPIRMPEALPERPARVRTVVLGRPVPKPRYVVPSPAPLAYGQGALSVGIIATGGTTLTSVPANLLIGPQANITEFTIVSLDAGSY